MRSNRTLGWSLAAFMSVAVFSVRAYGAGSFTARAAVEKTKVYVGESFVFQIQVEGGTNPQAPDVSGIKDFTVKSEGSQVHTTIVNWKTTTTMIFSYRLTAKRTGVLTIPAIRVTAGGQTHSTQAIAIQALKPAETDDFKLRLRLSESTCYVGQPVTLTVTLYFAKSIRAVDFTLPILSDKRFAVLDVMPHIDPTEKDLYLSIPLGSGEVIARKGKGRLGGAEYTTLQFQKTLIPRAPGTITIPAGTVACRVVVGYKHRRSSGDPFFDDFLKDSPFFGRRQQAVLRKVVVPSNEPPLTVRSLPQSGRPVAFNGLVGKYRMVANATPTNVRVGDPITLTIQVAGPDYMENVELPPLYEQPALARDFKAPKDMAPGKVEGPLKTFTQTIRARRANIKAIPSIELPYFDAETGTYAVAKTDPIPIKVTSARVVTAEDAEGRVADAVQTKTKIQTWAVGIAHNYEGPTVLVNQAHGPALWLRSPLWMAMLGLPPLVYILVLVTTTAVRRRNADPAAVRARRAYGEVVATLRRIDPASGSSSSESHTALLQAVRRYLGDKLRLSAGALTYRDVASALQDRKVDAAALKDLEQIFAECEASRYAGGSTSAEGLETLLKRAQATVRTIERSVR